MVTGYSAARHEAQVLPKGQQRFAWHARFRSPRPASWANPAAIPYVAATSLLDAYWQLLRRPDLAFTSLWSATNNSYNDLFLADPQNAASEKLTDRTSIDFSLKGIAARLHLMAPISSPAQSISIQDLIRIYLANAPARNFHFVAQLHPSRHRNRGAQRDQGAAQGAYKEDPRSRVVLVVQEGVRQRPRQDQEFTWREICQSLHDQIREH
nr:hypothetical protein [Stenotrophomonas geniculata]